MEINHRSNNIKSACIVPALLAGIFNFPALAESNPQTFSIPAQPMDSALTELADSAGLRLLYQADTVGHLRSQPVSGARSPEQALNIMLSDSGLDYRKTEGNAITVEKSLKSEAADKENAATLKSVTVVGEAVRAPDDPYYMDYNRPNATTATKTDAPIMETPVSIQVVPRGVIADKQSMTLPDAVNGHVSGVLGRTGGGFLYDNFIIRGLAGSGFGDAYRNGLFNRQDIYDIANIEQIDILKGPAAVLYGRIEPGGLVNYVTKKPLDTPYYSLQQQFGSYDQYRTLIDATGPINDSETLLYRLNGSYTNNESFRDFVGKSAFLSHQKLLGDLIKSSRRISSWNTNMIALMLIMVFPLLADVLRQFQSRAP